MIIEIGLGPTKGFRIDGQTDRNFLILISILDIDTRVIIEINS